MLILGSGLRRLFIDPRLHMTLSCKASQFILCDDRTLHILFALLTRHRLLLDSVIVGLITAEGELCLDGGVPWQFFSHHFLL